MRPLLALALFASALCVACGTKPAPPAACTPVTSGCELRGRWDVRYEGDAGGCAPGADQLSVTSGADGGLEVTFVGRDAPASSCSPQTPSTAATTVEVTGQGCTLKVKRELSWCTSGEGQCDRRELTLAPCSDGTLQGTLSYVRCWCPTVSPAPRAFEARGSALP